MSCGCCDQSMLSAYVRLIRDYRATAKSSRKDSTGIELSVKTVRLPAGAESEHRARSDESGWPVPQVDQCWTRQLYAVTEFSWCRAACLRYWRD